MKRLFSPTGQKILLTALVIILVIAAGIVWRSLPVRYEMYDSETISYIRGVVTEVHSDDTEDSEELPGWKLGVQNISVRISSGEAKGQTVTFDNYLSTTHAVDASVGLRVIVKADCPDNITPYYSLYQYDRSGGLCMVALIFALAMTLVGKSKGLRGAIGLALVVVLVAGVLIPCVYNGYSPIGTTVLVCMAIVTSALLLLNGFRAKTGAAILAAALGLLAAAAFYGIFSALLHLTGYHLEESEELILISRNTGLQLRQVLFSGILISSLGALMDTTMSIASSLYELRAVHPQITARELFRSGMTIGGDMIGTMCQTLVLAFVGSSLATLLVLASYGTQFTQFLSSDLVALEVLQSMTGSLAVIFAVPLTSALCCAIQKKSPTGPKKKAAH